jgi:cytochrome c oxidase subunit 3
VQTVIDPVARERELNSVSTVTVTVVVAAVTMTFSALIAVFFYRSQSGKYWGHLVVPRVLWVTTALLLLSSYTLERARGALARHDQQNAFLMMKWTTGLAIAFLSGQLLAWFQVLHSGVNLANNAHSWFIFLFSGLHGLHILLGLCGLGYLLFRTREPASGQKYQMINRVSARGVSIYWHYLDFLWVLMFALLLLWKR